MVITRTFVNLTSKTGKLLISTITWRVILSSANKYLRVNGRANSTASWVRMAIVKCLLILLRRDKPYNKSWTLIWRLFRIKNLEVTWLTQTGCARKTMKAWKKLTYKEQKRKRSKKAKNKLRKKMRKRETKVQKQKKNNRKRLENDAECN